MVFNSVIFVYLFLPVVTLVHLLLGRHTRLRNIWLLMASFLFYGWCNTRMLAFLLAFCGLNYWFGRLLGVCGDSREAKRVVLFPAVAANLGCLFAVKYLNFAIDIGNSILHTGISPLAQLMVPLGISFLVFTAISYQADIFCKRIKPIVSPVDCFLYLSFFPKVSQGPITRGAQMQQELAGRTISLNEFCCGLRRFCFGLAKKVLIADTLGASADLVFANLSTGLYASSAWAGIVCYTFQIFFDFSGYSDMAIGIGAMLGFRLPENFNAPYLSKSVSEFWRRWHITLGLWFREYVYIPLGGNRRGSARTILNLAVVWLLTGVWHGAAYTYVVWGVFMGCAVIFEKLAGQRGWYRRMPAALKWLGTFLMIMISWVFFRSPDLPGAALYLRALLGLNDTSGVIYGARYYLHNGTLIALAAAVLLCLPRPQRLKARMQQSGAGLVAGNASALLLLAVTLLFMVNSTYNAFIYFQF